MNKFKIGDILEINNVFYPQHECIVIDTYFNGDVIKYRVAVFDKTTAKNTYVLDYYDLKKSKRVIRDEKLETLGVK